ncbi:DUF3536 domain-containing protein [Brachyspira hyodysenteriae]|uniref:DUF3536 domain-containing protein n=1 Tax=Brachyspira hyodysenteriae TaxID=159 RepID=UPI0022CD9569|nr:DUF3536 domain-containing protein [Brachyspira hyodysenteriae]MCZ9839840.1 DUF3536 domain-containing protein [Brachyspira hyodysenteriae]MCZ9848242.1 DUF3536 domain-containing protein [Brachyspira hyodysenteriae]MCZ9851913.1 DUF3536 domain-containing protein [Brachyspira hyodysenteriae]MCZ9861538.1 DUF3536 domain-containing protein [Brachyspira hyodysenteriae]MCZ9868771.1 DUF3536 domain-containing protein [Brachyspira hyodysenteriae]
MRYLILHGHFYQPPRENPFLGEIQKEASAAPAHDWNERITNECYSPNAYSRILDGYGRINDMSNNYEYMSFNFGPTLLDYIAKTRKDLLDRILEADKKSIERIGYGNAIAQVYNHIILPLAKKEDMRVQIKWGLYNFEKYFGRKSSGIWLSETAINLDVVDALYDCGVKFTILSPYQAHYVKNITTIDVSGAKIDTSKPYWLYGHNGKRVAVFFYDAYVSQAIAFEHLLTSSDKLAEKIRNAYGERKLVNIATDGESYGHHEPFADMCLARYFKENVHYDNIIPTNYEHYLNIHPPTEEVILHEGTGGRGTSWSCSHGVERWRSNCGCGGWDGCDLSWRGPLREAFDILRKMQDKLFKTFLDFTDETRNSLREEYVRAIYNDLDARDLYAICSKYISFKEFVFLMESYKYSLFTYTSCGWFFEDVSRLEPIKNMQYAEQSFHYARLLVKDKNLDFVDEAQKEFLKTLEKAISNKPEHHNAKYFYEKEAKVDVFAKLYVINYFIFNLIASEYRDVNINIFKHEIKSTKIEKNIIEGILIDNIAADIYFRVNTSSENHEFKNQIQISENYDLLDKCTVYTMYLKDLNSDIRDKLADSLFESDIKKLDHLMHEIYPEYRKLFTYFNLNSITPDYDYRRIMGAMASPILREKIINRGRDAYDEVSGDLKDARSAGIFISNSGISSLIGDNIKNALNTLYETGNTETIYDALKDIKFLSNNDMPIDRNTFENIFYKIILKYKNTDIKFNDEEKASFKELGYWLNFNMDNI